jgi:hypothetical protein
VRSSRLDVRRRQDSRAYRADSFGTRGSGGPHIAEFVEPALLLSAGPVKGGPPFDGENADPSVGDLAYALVLKEGYESLGKIPHRPPGDLAASGRFTSAPVLV